MTLFEYKGVRPTIGKECYIADSAEVIGDVHLGDGCYVGPGAVIRGDYGRIRVGNRTAVEELVMIHARPGEEAKVGSDVTLGHGAIIHTPKEIADFAVIGMGAIISDWAVVGEWAAIGEGAVVKNKQEIPTRAIAVGIPAKVIGEVDEKYMEMWKRFKQIYVDLARNNKRDLKRI